MRNRIRHRIHALQYDLKGHPHSSRWSPEELEAVLHECVLRSGANQQHMARSLDRALSRSVHRFRSVSAASDALASQFWSLPKRRVWKGCISRMLNPQDGCATMIGVLDLPVACEIPGRISLKTEASRARESPHVSQLNGSGIHQRKGHRSFQIPHPGSHGWTQSPLRHL